ncbi:hypothetical protein EVAR_54283_1 [Eumeta japonica]|uniref:Metallothionein n=1 Tax=Eumeta variegata TaxID=151549 RepID=A0A4C1YTE5_EUMVA|nr:hypothetical protein EVAR_54283_1 [Eumeta japonica]
MVYVCLCTTDSCAGGKAACGAGCTCGPNCACGDGKSTGYVPLHSTLRTSRLSMSVSAGDTDDVSILAALLSTRLCARIVCAWWYLLETESMSILATLSFCWSLRTSCLHPS